MRFSYSQHPFAGRCSGATLSAPLQKRRQVSPAAHSEPPIQLKGIVVLALEVEGLR